MRNLVIASLSLIFSLLLCEGILHLWPSYYWGFEGIPGTRIEGSSNTYRRSPYDNLTLELMPSSVLIADKVSHHINEQGFRGEVVSSIKPAGKYRIEMVGDSVTFGLFIADFKNTFPFLIQEKLNASNLLHNRVEVVNTGVPGYQVRQYESFFINRGVQLNPDLVVLNYSPWDCSEILTMENVSASHTFKNHYYDGYFYPSFAILPDQLEEFLVKNVYFYRLLSRLLYSKLSNENQNTLGLRQYYVDQNRCISSFKKIRNIALANNAKVIMVVHSIFKGNSWEENYKWIRTQGEESLGRQIAQELEIPFLELSPIYRRRFESPRAAAFDLIHPNERANLIIADELVKLISNL